MKVTTYIITCTDINARDGEPRYSKYKAKLLRNFRVRKQEIYKELGITPSTIKKLTYEFNYDKQNEMKFFISHV